jgi:hypothetical protein
MHLEISPGVLGQGGVHWGTTPTGQLVLFVQAPQGCVRLVMSAAEGKDLGCAAIYLATSTALESGHAADVRPASLLVGSNGAPL